MLGLGYFFCCPCFVLALRFNTLWCSVFEWLFGVMHEHFAFKLMVGMLRRRSTMQARQCLWMESILASTHVVG